MRTLCLFLVSLSSLSFGCNIPRFSATRDFEKSIELQDVKRLVASSQNGSIRVVPGEGQQVQLLAHLKAMGTTQEIADELLTQIDPIIETNDGTLSISTPESIGMFSSISFELQVPTGLSMMLKSSNGAIHVQNVAGQVQCQTSNGQIEVEGAVALVTAKTSNGRISLKNCHASIDAQSSNGRVEMNDCHLLGNSRLKTSNGAISVQLASDHPIALEADTSNGSIKSELPLENEVRKSSFLSGLLFATSQEAPFDLKLKTSNGSITIQGSSQSPEPTPTPVPEVTEIGA